MVKRYQRILQFFARIVGRQEGDMKKVSFREKIKEKDLGGEDANALGISGRVGNKQNVGPTNSRSRRSGETEHNTRSTGYRRSCI